MASTGYLDMNNFAINNHGITDLRKLLFLTVIDPEGEDNSLKDVLEINTGIEDGERVGGVGEFAPVGLPSSGCNPDWKGTKLATAEKQWKLGEYEIAEEICFADLEKTIVQYAMRRGTDIADLTGTDYIDAIVEPRMVLAMNKMLWRLAWFGDITADDVTGGGFITDGINLNLFHVCDGLFKRIFDIVSANPLQGISIAANSAATKIDQIAGIRASGVATSLMDKLIYDSNPKLLQHSDRVLLVTKSIADALAMDIKANNKGSDLQWQSLFNGFASATVYNQQQIISLPIWDEMIRMFEDDGTVWNLPHRAIYAPKSSLKLGINSNDMLSYLDIFFDKKSQTNNIIARDKVGTMTWEDDLIMAAY